jgi:hypothetical protein
MYDGSAAAATKKGELHFILHGGVQSDDLASLRHLVRESGVPAVSDMTDLELTEAVRGASQPSDARLFSADENDDPRDFGQFLSSGGTAGKTNSGTAELSAVAPRRLTLTQFSGVIASVERRQRLNSRPDALDPNRHQREEDEFADALMEQVDGAHCPSETDTKRGAGDDARAPASSLGIGAAGRLRSIGMSVLHQRLVSAGMPLALRVFLPPGSTTYDDDDCITLRDVQAAVSGDSGGLDRRRGSGFFKQHSIGGGGAGNGGFMDSATLFRRLGGDPEDSAVYVNRISMLRLLKASGLAEADVTAYRQIIERIDPPNVNFDRFINEIVPQVDVFASGDHSFRSGGASATSSPLRPSPGSPAAQTLRSSPSFGRQDEAEQLRRTRSRGRADNELDLDDSRPNDECTTSDADDILVLDEDPGEKTNRAKVKKAQMSVMIAIATAGASNRARMSGAETVKVKIRKLLGEHVARSHQDCTFPKSLTHLLRLDVVVLSAFVIERRSHIRSAAAFLGPVAMRVLRVLDRVIALLRSHHSGCRVCYDSEVDSLNLSATQDRSGLSGALARVPCTSSPKFHLSRLPPVPRCTQQKESGGGSLSGLVAASAPQQPSPPPVGLRAEGYTARNMKEFSVTSPESPRTQKIRSAARSRYLEGVTSTKNNADDADSCIARICEKIAHAAEPALPVVNSSPRRVSKSPRLPSASQRALSATVASSPRKHGNAFR